VTAVSLTLMKSSQTRQPNHLNEMTAAVAARAANIFFTVSMNFRGFKQHHG
jgi:hypothetical protein